MILKSSLIMFMTIFISVEMLPLMSVSRDMSIILECNSTSPVNKITLNMALIEKHIDEDVVENFKCFLHCLYYNYKWMDRRGIFQHDEMRNTLVESNLDESSIEYLLKTCTETQAEDKCDRAISFTECFWMESKKLEQFAVE